MIGSCNSDPIELWGLDVLSCLAWSRFCRHYTCLAHRYDKAKDKRCHKWSSCITCCFRTDIGKVFLDTVLFSIFLWFFQDDPQRSSNSEVLHVSVRESQMVSLILHLVHVWTPWYSFTATWRKAMNVFLGCLERPLHSHSTWRTIKWFWMVMI